MKTETEKDELIGKSDNPLHDSCSELFASNLELLESNTDVQAILQEVIVSETRYPKGGRDVTRPLARAAAILIRAEGKARGMI